jgi:pimeloyl-ACP methyl ester carboxylesterase
MGGFFAGTYAARYPDEILSLGLFNAGGVMPSQFSDVFRMMEKGENPLLLKDENDFDRLMGLIFYKMPLVPYPIK